MWLNRPYTNGKPFASKYNPSAAGPGSLRFTELYLGELASRECECDELLEAGPLKKLDQGTPPRLQDVFCNIERQLRPNYPAENRFRSRIEAWRTGKEQLLWGYPQTSRGSGTGCYS